MLPRFTGDAARVMQSAVALTRDFGHGQLLPQHLVIAVAAQLSSRPGVALIRQAVTFGELRAAFASRYPEGSFPRTGPTAVSAGVDAVFTHAVGAAGGENEKVSLGVLFESLLDVAATEVDELLESFGTNCDAVLTEYDRTPENVEQGVAGPANPVPAEPIEFCRDLTEAARKGDLDPVIGRTVELRRVTQVLARRVKNNPVLVGDPGVGKTAIAEGLAALIVDGKVPAALKGRPVLQVDLAGMVAGTRYRGDFEERLKKLMKAAKETNAILFVDEIHTVVGAGAASSSIDAGQMLKESLARGELTMMGATTVKEYRKHIEPDAALERRFTQVVVEEPSNAETREILERISGRYESHHGVTYAPDALDAAVKLADKHIRNRFAPDKAIDVIDEAGAALAMEVTLDPSTATVVTAERVAEVVSQIAGVTVGTPEASERESLRDLQGVLSARVVGQDEAVQAVSRSVRRRRSGMASNQRPASFLFAGPTGVGKTELAKALADTLFADLKTGRGTLVRFDMSEFGEKHNIARLFGAPPGYVGYDEGGELTEAVRRNPASVVLLDEVDKAHPDVFDALLQVLDDGRMTDGQGRVVSFADTVVIMTTNFGAREASRSKTGFGASTGAVSDDATAIVRNVLKSSFRPEFLNRLDDVLIFDPLGPELMDQIGRTMVEEVIARALDLGVALSVTDRAVAALVAEGTNAEYGARPLRRTVERRLADQVTDAILDDSGTLLVADVDEDGAVVVNATTQSKTPQLA